MLHKHVLCAVDGSDESHQVLQAARAVAQREGAQLTLISVIKPVTYAYGGLDMAVPTRSGLTFEEEAVDRARQWLADVAAEYGIEGERIVVIGAPAAEIRSWAKDNDVDLIVIGSHGRHGLGLLLGSTANAVLHGVSCDALVVRVRDEA